MNKTMNKNGTLSLLLILALFIFTVISSNYWHSFGAQKPSIERHFNYFEHSINEGQESCFSLAINQINSSKESIERIEVKSNDFFLFEKQFALNGNQLFDYCIPENKINSGSNLIEINFSNTEFGKERLFYNVFKENSAPLQEKSSMISNFSESEKEINLTLFNGKSKGVFSEINFSGNDFEKRKFISIPALSSKSIKLNKEFFENESNIEIKFNEASSGVELAQEKKANPALNAIIFLIVFFFTGLLFLKKFNLLESLSFTFAYFISLFILIPWILNSFKIPLNSFSLTFSMILVSVLFYLFLKNKKFPETFKAEKGEQKIILFGLILSAALFFLIQLIIPSHINNWNVFYERQASLIIESSSIPLNDPLSYLGRGFTFIWGYFLFNSSLSLITNLNALNSFSLIVLFSNFFLLLSFLYLMKSLDFTLKKSLFLFFLYLTSLFIFNNWLISPKHTLSLALMLFAAAMLNSKRNHFIAGIFGGLAAFTQISFIVLFPLTYIIASKEFSRKKLIYSFISAFAVFLILFSPILFNHGIPFEVKSKEWGYLITHNVLDLLNDLGQLVFFLFLITLILCIKNFRKLSSYTRKIFFASIALILVQLFVSFRINIIAHLSLVILFGLYFFKSVKSKWIYYAAAFLLAFSFFTNIVILSIVVANADEFNSLNFLNQNSFDEEKVLADPFYGHLVSFNGNKVLSDLYVEYAVEEYLNDSYEFILGNEKNKEEILSRHGIDFVFFNKENIFLHAKQRESIESELDFTFMDKIYVNSSFSIHKKSEIQ
ncbi:MAG TPA: hypothetical protein VJK05_03910 [archaeon]|nr:hypothetical protein [archaeon]